MNTITLKGKPKKTVTLEVDGQTLTFAAGVEVAVFVVVSGHQDADERVQEIRQAPAESCWYCAQAANPNNHSVTACPFHSPTR